MTDQHLPDAPAELRTVPLADLLWLVREAGPKIDAARRPRQRRRTAATKAAAPKAFKVAARKLSGPAATYAAFLGGPRRRAGGRGVETREGRAERRAGTAADLEQRRRPSVDQDVLLTEHGVALAFAEQHRDRLRYCHDTGAWFVWTGTHWRQDRKHTAFSLARDLVAEANRDAEFKTQAITGKAAFAGGVERFASADQALAVTADPGTRTRGCWARPAARWTCARASCGRRGRGR